MQNNQISDNNVDYPKSSSVSQIYAGYASWESSEMKTWSGAGRGVVCLARNAWYRSSTNDARYDYPARKVLSVLQASLRGPSQFSDYVQARPGNGKTYEVYVTLFSWLTLFADMIRGSKSHTNDIEEVIMNCPFQAATATKEFKQSVWMQALSCVIKRAIEFIGVEEVEFWARPASDFERKTQILVTAKIGGVEVGGISTGQIPSDDIARVLTPRIMTRIAQYGIWSASGACRNPRSKGVNRSALGGKTVVKFRGTEDQWRQVKDFYVAECAE